MCRILLIPLPSHSKQHRWVKSLQNFVSTYVQASDKNTRIKIALIDDGVDAEQQDLRSIVKGGWPTEEPTSSGTPFYQSTEGHGTTMARLIAIACPHVDLYVAKLKSLNKVVSRDDRWRLAADDSSDVWTSTADEAAKVSANCLSFPKLRSPNLLAYTGYTVGTVSGGPYHIDELDADRNRTQHGRDLAAQAPDCRGRLG